MVLSRLKLKELLPITLAFGLVMSSTFTSAWGAETTISSFQNAPAPAAEQTAWVNRVVAIGVGALAGAIVYSIATRDWGWAWGLWGMATSAARRVTGVGAPTAATRITGAGVPTAATRITGAGVPAAAARAAGAGAPAVAAGVARAGTPNAITWSNVVWAGRVVVVTLSALTGAFLGYSIYDKA